MDENSLSAENDFNTQSFMWNSFYMSLRKAFFLSYNLLRKCAIRSSEGDFPLKKNKEHLIALHTAIVLHF